MFLHKVVNLLYAFINKSNQRSHTDASSALYWSLGNFNTATHSIKQPSNNAFDTLFELAFNVRFYPLAV